LKTAAQLCRSEKELPGWAAAARAEQRSFSACCVSPPDATVFVIAWYMSRLEPRTTAIRSQKRKSVSEGNANGL
jgi:hypothetical protein